jgi:transcriptional antiterminator RfaH
MPILPLEPFVFPENLLSEAPMRPDGQRRWWALHTKPRTEKSLARQLLRKTVPFFLPLFERKVRRRGKVQSSFLPLFPGYMFLLGGEDERVVALETNLIVKTITTDDQDQLQADLVRIYQLTTSGAAVAPEDRIVPGTLVEITTGPLAGIQGVVLRRGKELKLFVKVDFLQRGASVEVEQWMLRPVS